MNIWVAHRKTYQTQKHINPFEQWKFRPQTLTEA